MSDTTEQKKPIKARRKCEGDDCRRFEVSNIGDCLARIIESDWSVRLLGRKDHDGDCGCKDWKAKMNRWGLAGCKRNRKQIIDHLVAQAHSQTYLLSLASKFDFLSFTGLSLNNKIEEKIREHADKWLDQAMEEATSRSVLRDKITAMNLEQFRDSMDAIVEEMLIIHPNKSEKWIRKSMEQVAAKLEASQAA